MLTELIQAAEIRDIVVSERMKVYEASFKFDIGKAPAYGYFSNIIRSISERDKIKITLQDESERICDFTKTDEDSYKKFIEDTLDDEVIDVKIRIDKEVIENHFSVYSFDDFVNDILSLPIEEVMMSFSSLLKLSPNFLVFDVYSPIAMFATKTMFFVPCENRTINTDFNRIQRIQDCKEVSYFYNFDIYEILPDDFKITIDYENNPLTELFQKIMVLLSISFIATSSSINGNQLKGVISGQRTTEYCCEMYKESLNQGEDGIVFDPKETYAFKENYQKIITEYEQLITNLDKNEQLNKLNKLNHKINIIFHDKVNGDENILFTGDAEESDINEIVSKTDYPVYDSYKFIKVPHHGTRTHYYDFLKYNPAYILISNGVVKGHENDDAYKIDKRYGALNAEHFCSNSNNCLCCMKSCNSNLYCCGKTKNIVFPSIYKVIR